MRATEINDQNLLQIRHFKNLDTVRGQKLTWTTGRLAARMRFQLVLDPIVEHCSGPRLQGNFTDSQLIRDRGPHCRHSQNARRHRLQVATRAISPGILPRMGLPSAFRGVGLAGAAGALAPLPPPPSGPDILTARPAPDRSQTDANASTRTTTPPSAWCLTMTPPGETY